MASGFFGDDGSADGSFQKTFTGGALDGLAVTNTYDQFLRRTNLASLNGSTALTTASYGYDPASRLATVSDGQGDTAAYGYLANSPLVGQITFQQGGTTRMTTTKQYDFANRLTSIVSQPSASGVPPVSFNYTYNQANQRTKDTLADGSYWVYQYDALGQVTNGVKHFYDGTLVPGQQFGYLFDDIGNRAQTTAGGDAVGSSLRLANYSVNNLNQITSRDYPGTNDIIGAALATNGVTVNGQTAWRKGEYFWSTVKTNNSASAQWLGVTVASGGTTNTGNLYFPQTPEQFRYDADGNLTNDGRWSYVWDAENRLIQMTVNTNVGPQYQLNFAYDSQGRRIQKTVSINGVGIYTNRFLYDGWNLIAEVGSSGALVRSYTWGTDLSGTMQGAGGVGGLLVVSYYGSNTTNCFPAFDGNGNVMALINAADGTSVAQFEYDPFLNIIRATGPMANLLPFLGSTKYYDWETGLYYYGHRYYKPSTGTWPSRDPLGELGFENFVNLKMYSFLKIKLASSLVINLYCMINNQPISTLDVLGLNWVPCGLGQKFVPSVTITHKKSTFGFGITDALPEVELPKYLNWLRKGLESADIINGLIGETIGKDDEYYTCVPANYVPTVKTTPHLDDPYLDFEPVNYYFEEIILYWFIEKDYTWHCPGFQSGVSCSNCNRNSPPIISPIGGY